MSKYCVHTPNYTLKYLIHGDLLKHDTRNYCLMLPSVKKPKKAKTNLI